MAAVFPQAAACQENVTGPIEIPDHVLVRQTISDTLHEALDVDGLRALLERIEAGEVAVHCVDTTEPSVLAHEILTARPYAFLDDEELQNRRTNAVHAAARARRSTSPRSARSIPTRSSRCTARSRPSPTTRRRPHDLLASLVVVPARGRLAAAVRRARRRGAAVRCSTTTAPSCGAPPRRVDDAGRAFAGDERRDRARRCAATSRSPASPPSTRLAEATTLTDRVGSPPASPPRAGGLRAPGPLHARSGRRHRVGVAPAAGPHALVLAAHPARRRRARHRAGLHALPAALAARRAGHPAGRRGRAARPSSSSSRASRPRRWRGSPSCSARRLRRYDPAWLDRLCHDGEVALAAAHARRRATTPTRPSAAPSKATPISVVVPRRPAVAARWPRGPAAIRASPTVGATAEIIEVLRERGACFAAELGAATNRLPDDIERGAVGRRGPRAAHLRRLRRHPGPGRPARPSGRPTAAGSPGCARGSRPPTRGRRPWSLVRCVPPRHRAADVDRDELAEAVAELLLQPLGRGVPRPRGARLAPVPVARPPVGAAPARRPRPGARRPLRHRVQRRAVRAARPRSSSSPTCAERRRTGERVTVNATDPLNLVGVIVPGATRPGGAHPPGHLRRRRVRGQPVGAGDDATPATSSRRWRRGAPERARIAPCPTQSVPELPVLIEAAINGGTTKARNPHVPVTPRRDPGRRHAVLRRRRHHRARAQPRHPADREGRRRPVPRGLGAAARRAARRALVPHAVRRARGRRQARARAPDRRAGAGAHGGARSRLDQPGHARRRRPARGQRVRQLLRRHPRGVRDVRGARAGVRSSRSTSPGSCSACSRITAPVACRRGRW